MSRVKRMNSLLEYRAIPVQVALDKFGTLEAVEQICKAMRSEHRRETGVYQMVDGSVWVCKDNNQRDMEGKRAQARQMLQPWLGEGRPISMAEIVSLFPGVYRGPVDQVMIEAGYYCDSNMDREEGLEGDWFRPIGYEMPTEMRQVLMPELKFMYEESYGQDFAWSLVSNDERFEGITRTWFNNCWAVVRHGQQRSMG